MTIYPAMKTGARRALLCLNPAEALPVAAVQTAVSTVFGEHDRRTAFHLSHLTFIGLVDQRPLPGERVGYVLTELGVGAFNQIDRTNGRKSSR
ncbi:MAG: hypothetical protein WA082_04670 [Candidatus Moraniibacteriota bacterium]